MGRSGLEWEGLGKSGKVWVNWSGKVWVRVGRSELDWEGLDMSGKPGYEWGGLGKSRKV